MTGWAMAWACSAGSGWASSWASMASAGSMRTSTARITPSSPASPRAGRQLHRLGPRPLVANDRFRHIPRPSRRRGGSASSARTTDRRTRRRSRPWPRRQTGDSRGWRPALMTKYGYQSLRPPFRIGSGDLWTPAADRPGPGRPRLHVIHRPGRGRGRGRDVVAPGRRPGPRQHSEHGAELADRTRHRWVRSV